MPGTVTDTRTMDAPSFNHAIRMTIAGLCGECLIHGNVPEASSLDEVILSQSYCLGRTGAHQSAESLWQGLWAEACATIRRYRPLAHGFLEAFAER
jgi:hypothetical protein